MNLDKLKQAITLVDQLPVPQVYTAIQTMNVAYKFSQVKAILIEILEEAQKLEPANSDGKPE